MKNKIYTLTSKILCFYRRPAIRLFSLPFLGPLSPQINEGSGEDHGAQGFQRVEGERCLRRTPTIAVSSLNSLNSSPSLLTRCCEQLGLLSYLSEKG